MRSSLATNSLRPQAVGAFLRTTLQTKIRGVHVLRNKTFKPTLPRRPSKNSFVRTLLQKKPRTEFDEIMLARWTHHRAMSKNAECRTCAAKRGAVTHERKRVWKQTKYTCSQCKAPHPPSFYNYKKLATLEEEAQVYLAVCLPCEKIAPK
jgi:sulfur relay (sulfurtransferase) complex TusBCD TusD component (DsrE family)